MSCSNDPEPVDFCVDDELMLLAESNSPDLDESTLALIRHLLFTAKRVDVHCRQDELDNEETLTKFRKWALARITGGR